MARANSNCIICTSCNEVINGIERLVVLGNCNHKNICSLCSLRQRELEKSMQCGICETLIDIAILCAPEDRRFFEEFGAFNERSHIQGMVFDASSRLFIPQEFFHCIIEGIREHCCTISGCKYKANEIIGLINHVKTRHQKVFCPVCLQNKKVFPYEFVRQMALSSQELNAHTKKKDTNNMPNIIHPICSLCGNQFFDANDLQKHYQKHSICKICQESETKQTFLFRDDHELLVHLDSEHFVCDHAACVKNKKFAVFDSVASLQEHQHKFHSSTILSITNQMAKTQLKEENSQNDFPVLQTGLTAENPIKKRHKNKKIDTNNQWLSPPASSKICSEEKLENEQMPSIEGQSNKQDKKLAYKEGKKKKKVPSEEGKDNNLVAEEKKPDKLLIEEKNDAQNTQQITSNVTAEIRQLIGDTNFHHLHELSKQYREGQLLANEYYQQSYQLFPSILEFQTLFIQLVRLLPDETQRSKLEQLHQEFLKTNKKRLNEAKNEDKFLAKPNQKNKNQKQPASLTERWDAERKKSNSLKVIKISTQPKLTSKNTLLSHAFPNLS